MTQRPYDQGHLIVGNYPSSVFNGIVGQVREIRLDCETDIFDFGCTTAMLPPYAVRPLKLGDRIDTLNHG